MRIAEVKPTTNNIASEYSRTLRMVNTLTALRVHLRRWRDFSADAADIIADWNLDDFDTWLKVYRFRVNHAGETPVTTGIVPDDAAWSRCVTVTAPEIISLLPAMVKLELQRDRNSPMTEGIVLRNLMARGTLQQVDGRWRIVLKSTTQPLEAVAQIGKHGEYVRGV